VRYDGRNKLNNQVLALCEAFNCIAICPEYAIGLGIPRAPINIIQVENRYRVKGSATPDLDVTEELIDYANHIRDSQPQICGYVFKSRSPSCGLQSTPFFNEKGSHLGDTDGIFCSRIRCLFPGLPVTEETHLEEEQTVKQFQDAVIQYAKEHGVVD
jgi:uncharacterized protein YbbK (DUF523 family)